MKIARGVAKRNLGNRKRREAQPSGQSSPPKGTKPPNPSQTHSGNDSVTICPSAVATTCPDDLSTNSVRLGRTVTL